MSPYLILTHTAIGKAVKHLLKAQTLVAHPVIYPEPGRRYLLHPYGVIRGFLDFNYHTAASDCMGNSPFNKIRFPGGYLDSVEQA